jgi:DNA helicase-2/ATP-dependent DNA helicase PcrA
MGKSLWTDAGDGELIDLYEARTETDEADFIASTIQKHLDNGASASECAILYRSNAQSRSLEDRLIKYNIPINPLKALAARVGKVGAILVAA